MGLSIFSLISLFPLPFSFAGRILESNYSWRFASGHCLSLFARVWDSVSYRWWATKVAE